MRCFPPPSASSSPYVTGVYASTFTSNSKLHRCASTLTNSQPYVQCNRRRTIEGAILQRQFPEMRSISLINFIIEIVARTNTHTPNRILCKGRRRRRRTYKASRRSLRHHSSAAATSKCTSTAPQHRAPPHTHTPAATTIMFKIVRLPNVEPHGGTDDDNH